ncbi:LIM domain only protein 3 [Condylostylus longicornis]|uniref:LIM domain only protein 3 n=1 Tax=Condylostylus longicornis TaxID=2530218 RepID=UPI00244DB013|nr:LIM domain only protein 3 [Condylostylus longicornis]XP_055371009.1 LIM domain only protein 3 [Condylostylus longicornis]XP_055371010.1 LIM domain only protein 3 [Condylostylus longicornis]XP_055371011.1 LIM domain only protein 3 [Condylostylus longicornis]
MMTMDVTKTEPGVVPNPNSNQQQHQQQQLCAGCGKHIADRYLLRALDLLWHEDCLKCGCCDCRLGEVGSTLYTKGNLMLCRRDYLRLFGNTGNCAACNKVIPAFEMVMRSKQNVYHLECFACQVCSHRFCVGDKYYLWENKILCGYDYEERLVFASLANHPMLKRQASTLAQGSPPPPPPNGGLMGGNTQLNDQGYANAGGGGGIHNTGNMMNGPQQQLQSGQRTPGDHNNNNGPQTPTYGSGPNGTPTHMKSSLGASS